MKINRIPVMLYALLILTACGVSFNANAQGQQTSHTKEVKLYFPKNGNFADPKNNPSNLQPVARNVNAAAPLRPTIEALLKGPTAAEQQQGFSALDVNGLRIVRLTVANGIAHLSFAHSKGTGWAGDLSPLSFRDAVERTVKQFPTVSKTIICVDGLLNFGDESGGPMKRCPK